jgi:hypothetical protein
MTNKLDCVAVIFRVFRFIAIICTSKQSRKKMIFEIGDKILKIFSNSSIGIGSGVVYLDCFVTVLIMKIYPTKNIVLQVCGI